MELAASLSTTPTPVLIALAALALVEIGLDLVALVDLYRRPTPQVVIGNKWIWVAIILLVSLLGPILYLAIGRKPAPATEASGEAERPRKQVDHIVDSLYDTRDPTNRS
jgi:4-amino-4-deoxy-L-arabinose transferase-like glycosyltransferase